MAEQNTDQYMELLYGELLPSYRHMFLDRIQEAAPRSPNNMYEMAAKQGIDAHSRILDVGCGDGRYSCGLAARFGCHVTGVDLSTTSLEYARTRAHKEGVADRVSFQQGKMQELPFADATFDLVWTRSVLVHVQGLESGLSECARVLKPSRSLLLNTIVATDFCEPHELAWLCDIMAFVPENMSSASIESACRLVGLSIQAYENVGSEWAEYVFLQLPQHLQDYDPAFRVARLRRAREQIVKQFGQPAYDVMLATSYCHVALLVGKIADVVYMLQKATS